jgi:DNA helicase-2/ATP-dependent DNA helicase PcrA
VPQLNKEQEEAASFIEGIAAVIAVPGSGKTRTMMERIGKLVKDYGVPPESVLGVTFTRNAAEEMRSRLIPVLGDLASRVMLSTIHSFCYWVLKCEGKVFEILSGKEQLVFMRNILKQLRVKNVSLGMALREISLAKNNLITADEFRVLYEGDKTMLKVADIYEAYDVEKSKKLLLDFDDLLLEAYKLFSSHSAIKDKYSERFQHVLVDEFQDTNPIQLELLKCLISSFATRGSFWVCGDDWQRFGVRPAISQFRRRPPATVSSSWLIKNLFEPASESVSLPNSKWWDLGPSTFLIALTCPSLPPKPTMPPSPAPPIICDLSPHPPFILIQRIPVYAQA